MYVDEKRCIGCGACTIYCPVQAITVTDGVASIDKERCVECGVCLRNTPCPKQALVQEDLEYPRAFRRWFSDNTQKIPTVSSLGSGRGVDEVKTNDVTGYYKCGEAGLILEPGRPGISAGMDDVQKILHAFYAAGYTLTARSPMSAFVIDDKGNLRPELLHERVLSCSLEFKGTYADLVPMLQVLDSIQGSLNTVVCVGMISRVENGVLPGKALVEAAGFKTLPNAKVNIGLGRPLSLD